MSDEIDYCGLYKQYKEELDFIRDTCNFDDDKFFEYQKSIVGICMSSGLDPKYLLDSDIKDIKKREKLSEADRLKIEEAEKERRALVEKDRKKEEIELAKKMKRDGKPFLVGTNTYEKLGCFVENMKKNKRNWLAFAKKIARKPDVKEAAKFVVDNPQISMMAAGLVTISAVSTVGVAMFTAGAVSYYYEKVKEKNQEQSQDKNQEQSKKQTQEQDRNRAFMNNVGEVQKSTQNNISMTKDKGER